MLYGAIVSVKVVDTHHGRSPLVQGGLEIPVQMDIVMEFNALNRKLCIDTNSYVRVTNRWPV